MTPEVFREFLRVAREGGAAAFEVASEGVVLRVTMTPDGGTVARRPRPGEVEDRLGDVDEGVLFGSSGGGL